MSPFGWKPRARQQFNASKTRICSSRTVAGQFHLKSSMSSFGWKPRAKTAVQRRQSDSSQQQNSSRAVSNQIGHAPVRLEAATTESREVRVSHVTFNTTQEIPNSLALAKPTTDRAVPCRTSETSQQQNGGGVVSTQIGHTPVRLEAQGQTAVQCRQNEISQQQKNSSRAILAQIGHEPGRLEAQG